MANLVCISDDRSTCSGIDCFGCEHVREELSGPCAGSCDSIVLDGAPCDPSTSWGRECASTCPGYRAAKKEA